MCLSINIINEHNIKCVAHKRHNVKVMNNDWPCWCGSAMPHHFVNRSLKAKRSSFEALLDLIILIIFIIHKINIFQLFLRIIIINPGETKTTVTIFLKFKS